MGLHFKGNVGPFFYQLDQHKTWHKHISVRFYMEQYAKSKMLKAGPFYFFRISHTKQNVQRKRRKDLLWKIVMLLQILFYRADFSTNRHKIRLSAKYAGRFLIFKIVKKCSFARMFRF